MQRKLKGFSPVSILTGAFILSTAPLLIVELFPGQLKFVMDAASYLVFHNIAEFFSIMVSLSMFGVGWFTYDQSKDRHALFLGTAFLIIGLIDFMHTMGMPAMPDFITANVPNKSVQFWVAVRLFQGAAFLASAFVYPDRPIRWLTKKVLITSALLVSLLVFTWITFFPAFVPTTFVVGVGLTPLKKVCEYLVIGLLCAATAAYWRRMERTGDRLLIYYLAAFVVCIFSELVFAFYTRMFDTWNVLGHIYKVAAFSLIYYGIFKASVRNPYLRLAEVGERLKGEIGERKRTEEALREARDHLEVRVKERTSELNQSNAQLKAEVEDRRKAEEALRLSEEKFAMSFANNPAAIAMTRLEDGLFMEVNDTWVVLNRWSREEAIGRSAREMHIWPTPEAAARFVSELKEKGSIRGWEQEFHKKTGEVFAAQLSAHVLTLRGEKWILSTFVDITERKGAEEALRKAHDELETRVQERTSELSEAFQKLRAENIQRKRLEDTLRESEKQVRFFASQCLTAQEDERKRIAGELHDSIAASLGAMRFRIEKIAEEMKQGNGSTESLQDLGSKVVEINDEVRRIMADLRPSVLDDLGIVAAIDWFCREYQKTFSHISVEKQVEIPEQEVPDALKTPIFRISQEAMNNISKYSKASLVNLSLRKEDDKILLTIQDNGQGFDPNTTKRGMGLSTMRERAELSGGSFDVESTIGKGTAIRVSWTL